MKSKLTKVLLFALIGVLLFGTVAPSAYESYDTYTYSIDGEPLASPHAYTPDVETYDSHTMGLLAGYYWIYDNGDVAVWNGDGMDATSTAVEFSSAGLLYKAITNDAGEAVAYSVVGYNGKDNANLSIPAYYNGLPVTTIATDAFTAEDTAVKVEIGKITTLMLGENIKLIEKDALKGAKSIANIVVSSYEHFYENVTIKDGNGILDPKVAVLCADGESNPLEGLTFSSDGLVYKENLVENAIVSYSVIGYTGSNIENLSIPATYEGLPVTAISKDAFSSKDAAVKAEIAKIKVIQIGENVEKIEAGALEGATALEAAIVTSCEAFYNNVEVGADNRLVDLNNFTKIYQYTGYTSDGLVYELNEDGESYTVVGYTGAGADKILIPAEYEGLPVTAIGDGAFESDDARAKVELAKIQSVIISENIASIGKRAFAGTYLRNVYTELYEKDFSKDIIADDNRMFTSAKLYYYSDVTKFGNTELKAARDLATDNEGNLYIADTGNNRIVILNGRDYKTIGIIKTYTDEYGRTQSFNTPSGVFVTDPTKMVDGSSHIFVCDTNNKRIVVFNRDFSYERTIEEPDNALLDESDFTPTAMAVDIYGRIFAISNNCSDGVMVMSNEGDFTGFIGAQKVTKSLIDQIWESFKSAEDIDKEAKNLSVPFNNITVDDDGFVYVTISFTEADDLQQQFASIQSKTAAYSPVKKLNSMGVEIMKRNGFFDPGGEVVTATNGGMKEDVSKIIDISMGPEGSWTILDAKRSRLYTYDQNGNLLFAFGDKGDQVGNGKQYIAMAYQQISDGEDSSYNLVLLDDTGETGFKIIVYHPTEYCEMILEALRNQNKHNYAETITNWQNVLTSNNNFDLAYIGIGKALYNQGKYAEALEMLSSAYETEYYSKAFTELRKNLIADYMLLLFAGIILLLVVVIKFLGWAKRKNKANSLHVGKRTYGEELLYMFHLVFHPFDGFWDLKHEKRGSVRAAATILALTIAAFFYQAIGKGYMFNPRDTYSTVFLQVIAVIVPVLLWVVGNWCLTTLFDGEGSMKDIFIATCYSLAPLPLFVTVSTILTNVLTISEGSIVNLLVTFGYVWVGILLFFGMVVTHDYTTGKNVIATIGSIAAMAIIMFIAILFSSLVMKMITFLIAIVTEVFSRLA